MIEELFPVIQPREWPGAAHSVHRPFFDLGDSPLLVAYAVVTPHHNAYLTTDNLAQCGVPSEEIEGRALQNWVGAHHNLDWQPIDYPGVDTPAMAVRGTSDVVSTILLSHGHLKGVHKHFGSETLSILVPDRFTVIVHSDPMFLPHLARPMYHDAVQQGTQLSPYCFNSFRGQVVGYCEPAPAKVDPLEPAGMAVCCAFLMIASADGSVDNKEIDAFASLVDRMGSHDTGIKSAICRRLSESNAAPVAELVKAGTDELGLIATLSASLGQFDKAGSPADSVALRELAREIAHAVASASGGGLFGLGPKISKAERAALEVLEDFLNDPP